MPVAVASSAQDPIVIVAAVRVEVDPADAEQKEDAAVTITAVTELLATVGDRIVTAQTRDGASASVQTSFALDISSNFEVVYTDEPAS